MQETVDTTKTATMTPKPVTRLVVRGLDLGPGVAVSPMVGVTDLPFRRICRKFGANLTHCEMVAGPSLAAYAEGKAPKKVLNLMRTEKDEFPFGVQLFGSMPDKLHIAAKVARDSGADLIDLNMGCPTRKVAGSGSGSGLLREPMLAKECIGAIRSAVPDMPFTVKFRAGWDPDHVNCVEIARIIEGEGADGMTLHGRFRSQPYGAPADWSHIKRVKESVKIPVLGNGDIMTGEDAVRIVRETGCDGIMIARGVLGNPWVVRDAVAALEGRPVPAPPTAMERWEIFREFWFGLKEHRGEQRAIKDIRKHLIWFSRGLRGAHEMRKNIHLVREEDVLLQKAEAFFAEAYEYECARGRTTPLGPAGEDETGEEPCTPDERYCI
ncbi:tRNA dihydrouridine synthase DusB [bacterium]|nr:tRNA dihydrouridine synthase DusB [bacterium]MCB9479912.1 tRNA dihydrouridine synthase DusB [Deltaproteobacteria bacterium]